MKNLKYISLVIIAIAIVSCKSDELYFGDEIYNDKAVYPYVAIHDYNEDLDSLGGQNNYWSFELTPENNGTQVRIEYSTQDANIVSHMITVTLTSPVTMNCSAASFSSPTNTSAVRTLTSFPTDEIITVEQVASALGVSAESLSGSTVYFGGRSIDADDNVVEEVNDFEDYVKCERHAYLYAWKID